MPSLLDYLKSLPLYILPHHSISRIIFSLTRIKGRYLYVFINIFVSIFKINLDEAKITNSKEFSTFNAFFTRELKTDLRRIDHSEQAMTSPVDAHISQIGNIQENKIYQAKKHNYSLEQLLGHDLCLCEKLKNGKFVTLYLSPSDYHRVHMPTKGILQKMIYIPGRLFSVATHTVRVIPALFARNERVVTQYKTKQGTLVMVLVGAINVAAIETIWAGLITPPTNKNITSWSYEDKKIELNKAQEMGRFNMGSTVIILSENNLEWEQLLTEGSRVLLGQRIATYKK